MKKIISIIVTIALSFSMTMPVLASDELLENELSEQMIVTDETTLGELIKYTDPEAFYSFSEGDRAHLCSLRLKELEDNNNDTFETQSKERGWYPTFAAAISSSLSSPSRGVLSYSASLDASQTCPSLYLAATATEAITGQIVSSIGNTRTYSKKVTVANMKGGLVPGRRYQVYFYGVVKAPIGLIPAQGVVTSTKYINVK